VKKGYSVISAMEGRGVKSPNSEGGDSSGRTRKRKRRIIGTRQGAQRHYPEKPLLEDRGEEEESLPRGPRGKREILLSAVNYSWSGGKRPRLPLQKGEGHREGRMSPHMIFIILGKEESIS